MFDVESKTAHNLADGPTATVAPPGRRRRKRKLSRPPRVQSGHQARAREHLPFSLVLHPALGQSQWRPAKCGSNASSIMEHSFIVCRAESFEDEKVELSPIS